MCAKFGSIVMYVFRNITNKLFLPVKVFDPSLNVLEVQISVQPQGAEETYLTLFSDKFTAQI